MIRFTWDEAKRRSNLAKHGIDFVDCTEVFHRPRLTWLDGRQVYGETRFITIGLSQDVVLVVAHTETDELIRLISARKANRHEQQAFFEALGKLY